MTATPIHQ